MAIESSAHLHRALNRADHACIADSVSGLAGWRLILSARVTLRKVQLCETGALALLRGGEDDGFSLMLLDTAQGDTLWFQALSANSNIICIDNRERLHLLLDGEQDDPTEIAFYDEQEENALVRNISKACKRLAKRRNGRSRHCFSPSTELTSSPKKISNTLPNSITLPPRKCGVTSSPGPRRYTLEMVSTETADEQRRSTAPAKTDPSWSCGTRRNEHLERIERWLEATSTSLDRPVESPTVYSAPPKMIVQSPTDDLSQVEINNSCRPYSYPGHSSPGRSRNLHIPETSHSGQSRNLIHSSAPRRGSRTWKAKINNKEHEIPDVTKDVMISSGKQDSDQGGFGCIHKARLWGSNVALKQMKPSRDHVFSNKVRMAESKRFRHEVVIAMLCASMHHPNIVQFIGVAISEKFGACLVFPWMKNGNSLEYVNKHPVPRFPIIHGTLTGLEYLHGRHFVHGDMKAQNVLISDEGYPLISDFGLATHVEIEGEEQSNSIIRAGNARWMAPELLVDEPGKRTSFSDMWAFGMFAIEILTGDLPFPESSCTSPIIMNIFHDKLPERPAHPECSDRLWNLIQRCWTREQSDRITAKRGLKIMNKIEGNNGSSWNQSSEVIVG